MEFAKANELELSSIGDTYGKNNSADVWNSLFSLLWMEILAQPVSSPSFEFLVEILEPFQMEQVDTGS